MNDQALSLAGASPLSDVSKTFLATALLRARDAVARQFRPVFRWHNITEQQGRVLEVLASCEEIAVLKLARAADLLGPSLTRILRELDERGLITRRTAEGDLRSALISISPEGKAVVDSVSPLAQAVSADIALRMGLERLAELCDLLQQLEDRLP
jgi:homoprotocatechuate degradation regulator HpaR